MAKPSLKFFPPEPYAERVTRILSTLSLVFLGLDVNVPALEGRAMKTSAYMALALEQARIAKDRGEVPVGAIIVDPVSGEVLAAAGNRVEQAHDPTAHAEMLVIREVSAAQGASRLYGLDLYVTLEPCSMCAAAIAFARLRRLEFGAYDPKGGAVDHGPKIFDQPTCHHRPEVVGGVREQEASVLLKEFFAQKR